MLTKVCWNPETEFTLFSGSNFKFTQVRMSERAARAVAEVAECPFEVRSELPRQAPQAESPKPRLRRIT